MHIEFIADSVTNETLPHDEVTGVRRSERPPEPGADNRRPKVDSQRYTRVRTLGVGGMGAVVLCSDERLGRPTAVKALRPELDQSPSNRARFLREARIQARLDHPGIVPVYDIDANDSGSPRFTMRSVDGVALSEVIERLRRGDAWTRRKFSRRKLLTAFGAVCNAVHYAHTRGVLHRDIKPENVMLGEFGEVYLLDWGVARVLDDHPEVVDLAGDSDCKTERGQIIGTGGFIPPEQWIGGEADVRSDVYSLGALLFELLTYQPLHPGSTPRELMNSTFSTRSGSPRARYPEGDVPPELDQICIIATEFDRARRYESARDLHDAVERFLDGDRDAELRREAAARLVADVEVVARGALSETGTDAQRAEALRQAGCALALDPENTAALNALVRLLLAPPRALPREVEDALAANWHERVRSLARVGVWAYLSWILLVPVFLWFGVRDMVALGVVTAVMIGCAATAYMQATRARPSDAGGYVMLSASTLAIAAIGVASSPLLVVPAALVANTLIFAAHGDRMNRWVIALTAIVGMFLPTSLELAGVLAPSFGFEAGRLIVSPRLVPLYETPALVFMAAAHVVVFLGAGVAMLQARRSSNEELTRLNMLAWNLKQMAPEGARAAVDLSHT